MKSYKILLFLLFIFQLGFGQIYYRYPVTNYSTKEYGVFQGQQNWSIVQDADWNIYIGNDNGVLLFNGLEWDLIPVVLGQKVNSLAVDSKNRVYVGCSGGQFGYLEKTISGKYTFNELSGQLKEEDKPTSNIWRVFCINELAYFQCNEAIYCYSNNQLSTIKPEGSFHLSLFTGEELYARDRGRGLVKISGTSTTLINSDSRLKEYGLFALLKDDMNPESLVLFTQELGLFRINKKTGNLSEITTPDKEFLIQSKIFGAIKLPGNLFALNTQLKGTIIINHEGRIIKVINQEIGLMNNYVICQFYDKAGNLWLGLDKGVAKIEINSSLELLNENSGYSGNINTSGLHEDDIYLGTSTGLFCKKRNDARFTQISGVGQVWKIKTINSFVFIAAENGLFRIENGKPVKLFDSNCKALFYSSKLKKYFIGTTEGIYYVNEDFNNPVTITTEVGELYEIEEGKTEKDIKPFIWATTNNGNTVAIDINVNEIKIKSFTKESGLPHEWIYPFQHLGKIYFGGRFGVLELKGKSFNEDVIFDYALLSGQKIENSFSYFEPINEKEYYYVSDNFVHHFNATKNTHRKLQMVPETFGRINDVHLKGGKLLVSCTEGAVVYEEQKSQEISPVILRKIYFGDDSILYSGGKTTSYALEKPIAYEYNNIHFNFSAGDFSNEEYNLYKLKLLGSDSLIFDWKKGNSVSFNNLREGNYKLKIQYKNIFGEESEEMEVSFTILPPWYRTTIAYFGYVVIFFIALFASAKIASHRLKKQKKILEDLVAKRTAEIAGKNEELAARNLEILHQKQEITDSINYAKRIQTAILPSVEEIQLMMKEIFVLFMPKDIVSGDFYWFHKINEQEFLIACADCTGHGVPGGFMSMICAEKLNEASNIHHSPAQILSWVNKAIKKSLRQDGNSGSSKDGMEISLLKVSTKDHKITYAGANRFMWLIKEQDEHITEFKPTKAGIAGTTEDEQQFEEHEIIMNRGDSIFLSSDGFGDQFGGEKQKKLTTKKFKEVLLQHKHQSTKEQHHTLKEFILAWRGNLEQVDDILVIGLKF